MLEHNVIASDNDCLVELVACFIILGMLAPLLFPAMLLGQLVRSEMATEVADMNEEKIPVLSGGVSIWAFGSGAHVMASYTCADTEQGAKLKAAIEALVEKQEEECRDE